MAGTIWTMTLALALAQGPHAGSISGTVATESGPPAAGARLVCVKLPEYSRDKWGRPVVRESGFTRRAIAGPDGAFVFSDLPAGRYSLCAYGTQPNQVGSCDWGGVAVIQLRAGQSVQGIGRLIQSGAALTLRVRDPNGRISVPDAYGRVARERRFFIGLRSESGLFRAATAVSHSPAEHLFRITVPKQRPMRFFIDSDLGVTDARGKPLPTRQTAGQITAADRDELTVDLTVK